jgi:hypothetical protein
MKKLILSAALIVFTGCATIIQPGPDRIPVNSNPPGAQVFLDDQAVGVTPMVLAVPRDSDGRIRVEKEGYTPYSINRDKVVAGWVFGNILLGGVIGLSVDLITHNQGKHPEDPVYAQMAPVGAPASAARAHSSARVPASVNH